MSLQNKFSYKKTVTVDNLDDLNHVNNIEYVKWVQEASTLHWNTISGNDFNNSYYWVVLRHEIDYLASAKLNDKLIITTFIGESYGAKSERFVEISKNNIALVKAKTIWCLIDKNTLKPVRIPRQMLTILKNN